MISRIATILLCTTAPVTLIAQEVNLRTPDEFISVDGEIVGFNGVMLSVQTVVGQVSVPAAEVICYGEACLDVLANNDFGLTADTLAGVVTASISAPQSAAPAPAAPAPLGNDLTIVFASLAAGAFYSSVAGSVANAQVSGTTVTLPDGTTMTISSDLSAADIAVQTVSFQGDAEIAFAIPSGWAAIRGV